MEQESERRSWYTAATFLFASPHFFPTKLKDPNSDNIQFPRCHRSSYVISTLCQTLQLLFWIHFNNPPKALTASGMISPLALLLGLHSEKRQTKKNQQKKKNLVKSPQRMKRRKSVGVKKKEGNGMMGRTSALKVSQRRERVKMSQ